MSFLILGDCLTIISKVRMWTMVVLEMIRLTNMSMQDVTKGSYENAFTL